MARSTVVGEPGGVKFAYSTSNPSPASRSVSNASSASASATAVVGRSANRTVSRRSNTGRWIIAKNSAWPSAIHPRISRSARSSSLRIAAGLANRSR